MSHLWNQQEDEPDAWFAKFEQFRLLGPTRSLTGAYNLLRLQQGKAKIKSAPASWRRVAHTWNWQSRALAWDRQQTEAIEQAYSNEHRRNWEARRQVQRDEEWDIAEQLTDKAKRMLEYPLERQIKTSKDISLKDLATLIGPEPASEAYEHVQQGGVVIIMPGQWTFKDVGTYLSLASKLRSHAIGKEQIGELEAIKILVDAGWCPDHVLEVAQTAMAEAGNLIRNSIEGLSFSHRAIDVGANGYGTMN